jgi:hypothetical protein
VLGKLHHDGWSDEAVSSAAERINTEKLHPPIKDPQRVVKSVCRYAVVEAPPVKYDKTAQATLAGQSAKVTRMSEFVNEKVYWLWDNRIPFGQSTTIAGDPDKGKSLISLYVAACLTRGIPLYGSDQALPVGEVLMLAAEDDPSNTLGPRLDAAGADRSKILLLESVMVTDGKGETLADGHSGDC